MRVGQFIDTESAGGAETIALDLCRQLQARALEPVLLHFGSSYLEERARHYGIEQQIVPSWRQYKSFTTLPQFALQFRRFLQQQNIDVLHSHLYGPITAAAPACLLAGIPHVGTLHDVYVVAERPARIRLLQVAALLGTRLVCVSRDMENFYRQRAYFGKQALRTIYNGIRSMSAPNTTGLREALGLSDSDVVITCVGRLAGLKNHHLLLRAFSRLDPGLSARLLIVGDGPLREQLELLATELGVAAQVRFLGQRNDIPELLAVSDLFALASDTEGLSCSVLEAMSAGLPAVVTAVGGNPELVIDGLTGFLVEPGDDQGLREHLQTLALDTALRQQLGRAARQRAAALFSLDLMLEGYLRLYPILSQAATEATRGD
ncbi:MAG TPA: glycosyltransferase [Gammaproteobacteria bacterium]|nr:glycosyltransferase [Gammaproteobacteria bacterium]